MRRTFLAAALAVAVLGATASSAFAWEGAKWLPNTCGADLVAGTGNGSWWIRVSDESGVLYENSTIPAAKAFPSSAPLTVGGFNHDGNLHYTTYEVANAANHADGYVAYTQPQINCVGGASGREGPPGPPGPAGPPGPPGESGVCTSARVFDLLIAREFDGHEIVSATIEWRGGLEATAVKGADGRLRVSASFVGVKAVPGQVRVITIKARLAGVADPVTLSRRIRLCLEGADGNLNYATDIAQNGRPDGEPGPDTGRRAVRVVKVRTRVNGSRATLARLTLARKR